ncbi:MAG: hypothetical protein A2W90_21750 [Bacteroidetes bacterium GWF2_42_66]|nr:MAG: hypothetical protein A2W92_04565 [Bacteroidetes bacterium GWA2_42_15]OFY03281.1 MAG: hypothetical protein A2W89_19110 [Bacteroidetes bacterium GWE2_42_39]OFY45669.1 MAG: hypothetical protein A2W90_21750 [Bacteroidetes bacterium GWF2_42_66]HBL77347.1 hypothetical protein [Prolixibacteraceae bacterium]HCU62505.1 hypothetical protein [Prolixibacteraceae bacterium]
MKNLYLLLLCGCLLACTPEKSILQTIDFKANWDTVRVLKNPHKGWYHHLLDNGIDHYKIKDEIFEGKDIKDEKKTFLTVDGIGQWGIVFVGRIQKYDCQIQKPSVYG